MELIVAHMVGDYLSQNRWMALNKHKDGWIALLHSAIYALSVLFICGWSDTRFWIVFVSHFLIDFLRIGALWRKFYSRDTEIPWTILSDNTIHLAILLILSKWT
jgi:hypothetical protein